MSFSAATVLVSSARLSAASGSSASGASLRIAATSVSSVPRGRSESTSAVIVTEPVPPGATTPTAQDTVAALIVHPAVGRGVSPVGNVSVTTTSVAVDGPSLRYSTMYSTGAPADTAAGPDLVTDRSATCWSGV